MEVLPLQLLRSVMEYVLPHLMFDEAEPAPKRRRTSGLLPSNNVTSLSLNRIQWTCIGCRPWLSRWLPGTWTDTEIADRAVKSDNACIDFFPWNQRISLVLPWTTPQIIRIMEDQSFIRWFRALTRSLCQYLRSIYGSEWMARLAKERRLLGIGHDGSNGSRKRQKTAS